MQSILHQENYTKGNQEFLCVRSESDALNKKQWFRDYLHFSNRLIKYQIFTKKRSRHLLNFQVLKCGTYWKVTLNRRRGLFQSKISYSQEIKKFSHFIFPNNSK